MENFYTGIQEFVQSVISIFFIVNPVGSLPLFVSLTGNASRHERRKILQLAGLIALGILAAFAVVGKYVMHDVFHINFPEFAFGGGLLLVVIGIHNMMASQGRKTTGIVDQDSPNDEDEEIALAVTPIAFPLLVGPGSIVTVMLIVDRHGSLYGVLASAVSFFFVMAVLRWTDLLLKLMGRVGAIAVGKVTQIFIVAIGVHFIFTGIIQAFPSLVR